MGKKRKKKTVWFVPLTRKELLWLRTVPELLLKEMNQDNLLKEKPLANQEATVSAALPMEKSNTAQISGSLTQNPSMSSDIGSTSEWRRRKITKEISSGSRERGC